MSIDNYSKAYKEVLTILENVPEEEVKKIPENMIEVFKSKQDKNYIYEINVNKPFEEQEMLEETKAIFSIIFRDYWATPEQREKILAKEKYDREKEEEQTNLPIEIKKQNFFTRLIGFIKGLFRH